MTIHQSREEALRPIFTTSQLQKYIKYARSLKPEISPEAREVLVNAYRRLRQRDAGANGKTAYRITVRQVDFILMKLTLFHHLLSCLTHHLLSWSQSSD